VAFTADLVRAATVDRAATTEPFLVVDPGDGNAPAIVLVPGRGNFRIGQVRVALPASAVDLTRAIATVPAGTNVDAIAGALTSDDLTAWTALGLALTSADLVGVMRGALDVTVAYAADRRQYGVPVGSFQAVQHLLAEACCLLEGSVSVALHAAWAVDNRPADDALAAGRVAKAYCARAARTVCETAVQVHGGIGNTWECIAHVYLRRALLSSQWFGDDAVQLEGLQRTRLGVSDGLS
jgi:alkylation response protein AidB-like acyl-CoA dehydrogenase